MSSAREEGCWRPTRATGAMAIGAVAIARLAIKRAVIQHLRIEDLEVAAFVSESWTSSATSARPKTATRSRH